MLNKRMPESNKYIHFRTKSRQKRRTYQQIKKKSKNTEMLLVSNPQLFSAKDSRLSIRLSRELCAFFFQSHAQLYHNLKRTIYEDSQRLDERLLNIYTCMSKVNVDK